MVGIFGMGRRGSVDEAVLAELRAIRAEIHDLAERVATAATRDDLDGYVPRAEYEAHLKSHTTTIDTRRWWATYGLSVIAIVTSPLLSLLAVHISLLWR